MRPTSRNEWWGRFAVCVLGAGIGFSMGSSCTDLAWHNSAKNAGLLFLSEKTGQWEWSMRLWIEPLPDRTTLKMKMNRPIPARSQAGFEAIDPRMLAIIELPHTVRAYRADGTSDGLEVREESK